MNLQQLAYVVAVAEQRHFTRAAADLQVAQPSLSAAVRSLETELGAPLFHRGRGQVSLTPAGEALLPFAKRILADVETARAEVAALTDRRGGRVRLGATPSLSTSLLPGVLRDFRLRYPGIEVGLVEGGSRLLIAALDEGDLDAALVILPLRQSGRGLVAEPLLREKLVLAASEQVLGEPGRVVPIAELKGLPMLNFRPGYDLRLTLEEACRDAGFAPHVVVEGGEMDTVVSLAEAGVAACLLPITVARRTSLVTYTVDAPGMTRTVAIAYRKGFQPPTAVLALREVLDAHLVQEDFPDGVELISR